MICAQCEDNPYPGYDRRLRMIIYTFPNIATVKQRGTLSERYQKMKELNTRLNTADFRLIEVPVDFIKNITEETKTGLELGAMLISEAHAGYIYAADNNDTGKINYVLHIEPQLSRQGTKK